MHELAIFCHCVALFLTDCYKAFGVSTILHLYDGKSQVRLGIRKAVTLMRIDADEYTLQDLKPSSFPTCMILCSVSLIFYMNTDLILRHQMQHTHNFIGIIIQVIEYNHSFSSLQRNN
jgi:hypothetical protein